MDYEDFLVARRRLMARVTHGGFKRLTDPNYVPDLTRPSAEHRLRLSWPSQRSPSWLAVACSQRELLSLRPTLMRS
jgi:hypothetical protein